MSYKSTENLMNNSNKSSQHRVDAIAYQCQ